MLKTDRRVCQTDHVANYRESMVELKSILKAEQP